jgi:hypothetical protein
MKSTKLYWQFIFFLNLVVWFLLIFIFFNIIAHLYNYSLSSIEPFSMPGVQINIDPPAKMKEAYRPYLRKARLYSEDFIYDTNSSITRFLRKSGLY